MIIKCNDRIAEDLSGRGDENCLDMQSRFTQNEALMKSRILNVLGFAGIVSLGSMPVAVAQHHDDHHHHYDATLARVQHRLADMHLYHGAVDGIWGHETRHAIQAYQHRHNLHETGTVTDQLLHHLGLQ